MPLFDPEKLHSLTQEALGLPFEPMCTRLTEALAREYPGHIDPKPRWMYNLAGGALGSMALLHGSLSEYLIIFGSPIGTAGFSGRYLLDIYDFVLSGEMWTYNENRFGERVITAPGTYAKLPRFTVKGYSIQPGTWMLEYGRGPVPSALPMGLGEAILSGQDPVTVGKTLYAWGRLVTKELLRGKI